MSRTRQMTANPVVRSVIRAGVRAGLSDLEIEGNVTSVYDGYSSEQIAQLTAEEQRRQDAVDRINSADKRRNVDLARRLKCPPGTTRIRMRIEVHWRDEETGDARQTGGTYEVPARGRLSDIINQVLTKIVNDAIKRGSAPGHLTSADTSGHTYYRITYAECV